jgi:hypothetical protein
MTAAVSCDRSARLWIDQIEPWAGNAMRAARVPETRPKVLPPVLT